MGGWGWGLLDNAALLGGGACLLPTPAAPPWTSPWTWAPPWTHTLNGTIAPGPLCCSYAAAALSNPVVRAQFNLETRASLGVAANFSAAHYIQVGWAGDVKSSALAGWQHAALESAPCVRASR